MKKPEIILRLLRFPFDFFAVFGAFVLSYVLRARPELLPFVHLQSPVLLPWSDYLWFSLQAALLVVAIFAWEKMYSLRKSYRFRKELRRLLTLLGAAYTVIILYFFVVGIQFFSRFILGVSFVLAIIFMVLHRLVLRMIQHALWRRGIGQRRVLFIGEGTMYDVLSERWKHSLGFEILGRLASSRAAEELESVALEKDVEEVVQVSLVANAEKIVEFCQLNHIDYRFVPNMLEVQRTNVEMDFVGEIPVITLRSSAIDGWARVQKRTLDILGAGLGLIVLSPLLTLIAIGIKLDDGGPVFYRSKRISRKKTFWMWKFRSMVRDADMRKSQLVAENRRNGPLFKIENDPRVTRFGKLLRKTTLDELPQLWNVLLGDVSLVGPRAHLQEEIAQYEKHHRKVLAVKAGVTGLAQVSGRSKLPFEEEVKLDLYYLENWSLWMDLKIILRTFGVLLDGE